VAVVTLSSGLAACGSSSSGGSSAGGSGGSGASAAATTATTTTTVAPAADRTNAPALVVGDQAGTGAQALLEAAGLLHKLPFTVKFADFTSGPPILQAMSAGSIDVAGVGNAPPVFGAAGGEKIAIVGARSNNPKSAALLVPKGSSINSIKDLKGKKIAVAQGSSADYHLLSVLTKAGLTPKDVQLVYLQPAQALAALSSGAVDAWDVWSPYIEQAAAQQGAKVLVDGTGYGGNYAYEVAAQAAIADPAKAKEIREYLTVLNQAYRWSNSHPAAWAKTWAAATGLPQSVMNVAAHDDTTIPVPVNAKTTASEQTLVAAFSKAGLIPKSYSFAAYSSSAFNASVQ
jgi:sulfonate transport system substrate-binding protein